MFGNFVNKEPIQIDFQFILSISFGLVWVIYQMLFVKWNKIKAQGGSGLVDTIKISIQTIIVTLINLFLVLYLVKK